MPPWNPVDPVALVTIPSCNDAVTGGATETTTPYLHATGPQARALQSRYYLCVDATPIRGIRQAGRRSHQEIDRERTQRTRKRTDASRSDRARGAARVEPSPASTAVRCGRAGIWTCRVEAGAVRDYKRAPFVVMGFSPSRGAALHFKRSRRRHRAPFPGARALLTRVTPFAPGA